MEACVVICRTKKPKDRRNRILFINAINDVTRERAQSFLTDEHIARIVHSYNRFENVDSFARVVSSTEIREKGHSLSLALYVRETKAETRTEKGRKDAVKEAINSWQRSSNELRKSMNELFEALAAGANKPVAPERKPVVQPAFKRAVLAAEITAQLHREPTFGSVKQEKVIFLCEKHLGLTEALEHNYKRHAAGPYDPSAKRSIESNFARLKWFKVVRQEGKVTYVPAERFGGHRPYFERYFGDLAQDISSIVSLLRTSKTGFCEVVATLYAAWSDFLDQGVSPSDEKIVEDVLNNWHENKKRISREEWLDGLAWMRRNNLYPGRS
jgi:hypothetical protein